MREIGTITLPDFIRREEKKHPGATGQLTNVLMSLTLGTKIVSRGVAQAGLAAMLGLTGQRNVQGEEVQKLDEFADSVLLAVLGDCGEFLAMVSEEQDSVTAASEASDDSPYVIAFDPLDGSSNIDVNVAIGTIFGVYRRKSIARDLVDNFLQPGVEQVAAGYTVYGASTMFVLTTGNGVNGFTLDPTIGEFILTHPSLQVPQHGKSYSCNEGNFGHWDSAIQAYVSHVKDTGSGDARRPYSHRYVGSLVADFHRILLKGGVFLYPADKKNQRGKLRHLYEAAPLAFVVEQAGGRASNGHSNISAITPQTIHDRTPLFIGSKENVDEIERFIRERGV